MTKLRNALARLMRSIDRRFRQLYPRQRSNLPHSAGPYMLHTQPNDATRKIPPILPPNHSNNEDRRYERRLVRRCAGRWSRLILSNCGTRGILTERNARIERQEFPKKCPKIEGSNR